MHEIDRNKLSDQTKFRSYKTKKIENYFIKLNKYVTIFNYIDKILIVLCATSGWWSINYFIFKCYWGTSWNSKCKFYFNFFSSYWNS